jgi:hypothetical protein
MVNSHFPWRSFTVNGEVVRKFLLESFGATFWEGRRIDPVWP